MILLGIIASAAIWLTSLIALAWMATTAPDGFQDPDRGFVRGNPPQESAESCDPFSFHSPISGFPQD